jgi:hypothetical protein
MLVQPSRAATGCEVDRARKRAASGNWAPDLDTEMQKYELDLSDVVRCAIPLPAAKYRPTLTKTEKSNRTNHVSWKLEAVRTHERIAPLTRSSPCEDYRDGGAVKTMCLKPDEFIRRFLLHALPDGFHRIRHFGFLANGRRTQKLTLCRSLLTDGGEPTTRGKIESSTSAPSETVDLDPPPCPECGGVMRVIADLPRGGQRPRSERPSFWCDTS